VQLRRAETDRARQYVTLIAARLSIVDATYETEPREKGEDAMLPPFRALRPALLAATLLLLFSALPAATRAQDVPAVELPTAPYLPVGTALELASAALARCQEDGYRVSVAVVDRSGVLKAFVRDDGTGPHTVGSSQRKAYTAASLGRPTGELAAAIAENPAIEGLRDMDDNLLILGGGLPIVVNEVNVGGIGVGGAPGGQFDEACAQAALDSVFGAAPVEPPEEPTEEPTAEPTEEPGSAVPLPTPTPQS
jgi:uncharacterized protein GlcG (DUF336 family)